MSPLSHSEAPSHVDSFKVLAADTEFQLFKANKIIYNENASKWIKKIRFKKKENQVLLILFPKLVISNPLLPVIHTTITMPTIAIQYIISVTEPPS